MSGSVNLDGITPSAVAAAADAARDAARTRCVLLGEEFDGRTSVMLRDPLQVKRVSEVMNLGSYLPRPSWHIVECQYDGVTFFAEDRG